MLDEPGRRPRRKGTSWPRRHQEVGHVGSGVDHAGPPELGGPIRRPAARRTPTIPVARSPASAASASPASQSFTLSSTRPAIGPMAPLRDEADDVGGQTDPERDRRIVPRHPDRRLVTDLGPRPEPRSEPHRPMISPSCAVSRSLRKRSLSAVRARRLLAGRWPTAAANTVTPASCAAAALITCSSESRSIHGADERRSPVETRARRCRSAGCPGSPGPSGRPSANSAAARLAARIDATP